MYSPVLVDRLSNGQMTMSDADNVVCGITEVGELSQSGNMLRAVVDTVSRLRAERVVRTMDACAPNHVGACVLVKPTGHPIPTMNNMVAIGPCSTLPYDLMTFASRPSGINYSVGTLELIILVDKYVPGESQRRLHCWREPKTVLT